MELKTGDKVKFKTAEVGEYEYTNDGHIKNNVGKIFTVVENKDGFNSEGYVLLIDDNYQLLYTNKNYLEKVHYIEDGYVVETAEGDLYLKIGDRLIREGMYLRFENYNEKLECPSIEEFNIIRIYKPTNVSSLEKILNRNYLELVEVIDNRKPMTLEEIEKELGFKVKIVDKHE